MNVAIESANWLWESFIQGLGLVKDVGSIVRMWLKAEHCTKVWYSDSWTCLGQSVHSQLLSSLVPQCPVSHCSDCELSHIEAMVGMADSNMGFNMYSCVVFLFGKEHGFLVRCNTCSIIWKRESLHLLHIMIHWCCKNASFIEESIDASWSMCCKILIWCLLDLFVSVAMLWSEYNDIGTIGTSKVEDAIYRKYEYISKCE